MRTKYVHLQVRSYALAQRILINQLMKEPLTLSTLQYVLPNRHRVSIPLLRGQSISSEIRVKQYDLQLEIFLYLS